MLRATEFILKVNKTNAVNNELLPTENDDFTF